MKTQKKSSKITRLIPACKYSFNGFKIMLQEGAFKLEIYALVLILALCVYLELIWWKILCIVLAWLILLIVETLNTAIEACIDRVSSEFHPLSKLAKDVASFAVFLAFILAFIITIVLFLVF